MINKNKTTKKMKTTQHNPTQMIKCKYSNAMHRLLEPNIEVKASQRWRKEHKEKYELTDAQKVELANQIIALHKECSEELRGYRRKRGIKKYVERQRAAKE